MRVIIMEERRIPDMKEKKVLVFEEPKVDVIRFEAEDIITTSLIDGGAGGSGGSVDFDDLP